MSAKRLGAFLSNVTGTSGQILRVKTDESGFEMVTPATIPSYAVSNKTVDRTVDCNNTNLDELADVVGTLIDDLTAIGAPGAVQSVYVSGTYSVNAGNGGSDITVVHNLGSEPDHIQVQFLSGGIWYRFNDFNTVGATYYGWQEKSGSGTINQCVITLFNITGSMRVICAKIGQVAQIAPFQWSTSEQVWPFEKDSSGNTLYCKEVAFGALPNNGDKQVAHNISWSGGFTSAKLHTLTGRVYDSAVTFVAAIPYPHCAANFSFVTNINGTNVVIITGANLTDWTAYIRIIYSK